MKFIVDKLKTHVLGNFIELNTLRQLLTIQGDDGDEQCLLEDDNSFLSGLSNRVFSQLSTIEIPYDVSYSYKYSKIDPRSIVFNDNILPNIRLYNYQTRAALKFIGNGERGLLDLPTGAGKTEIACSIAKYEIDHSKSFRGLFMSDRVLTGQQTARRFAKYGIDVGIYGGEDRDPEHQLVVGIVDSLRNAIYRRDEDVMRLLKECELIIADEVHHLPTETWSLIASHCEAPKRLGLSASAFGHPDERTYEDMILIGHTGEVLNYLSARWLIDHGRCDSRSGLQGCGFEGAHRERRCPVCNNPGVAYLAEPLIHMINPQCSYVPSYEWHPAYEAGIAKSAIRNVIVAGIAKAMADYGCKVLILIQRIEHGETLLKLINRPNTIFSSGGGNYMRLNQFGSILEEERNPESVRQEFDEMSGGSILIGSTVYDEGVDIPSMNCLIMAGGGKAWRRTIQRIGRPLHSKDDYVYVFDFWDAHNRILLNHSEERKEIYDRMEYKSCMGFDFINQKLPKPLDVQRLLIESTRKAL